jgi:hypothetical protein
LFSTAAITWRDDDVASAIYNRHGENSVTPPAPAHRLAFGGNQAGDALQYGVFKPLRARSS